MMKTKCRIGLLTLVSLVGAAVWGEVAVKEKMTLSGDLDWRDCGPVVFAEGATIDLAGHKLYVGELTGAGRITDSSAGKPGELHVVVPAGQTYGNAAVVFSGNLRLVKDGPGTFKPTKRGHAYTGGTEITGGLMSSSCHAYTHKDGLLIRAGGSFDIDSKNVDGSNGAAHGGFTLDGGALVNSSKTDIHDDWDSIHSIWLKADSSFESAASLGLVGAKFGPSLLDLGGHVFTLTVPAGKNFRLWNADVKAGVLQTKGEGELWLNGGLRAAEATFDLSTPVRLTADGTVGNLTVRTASTRATGAGILKVARTFKPVSGYLHNFCLLDGATLDLSDVTGAYAAFSAQTRKSLRFASGATITVDVKGRKLAKGERLVSWRRKPTGVTFKLAAASDALVATRAGLYVGEAPAEELSAAETPARAWAKYEDNPVLGNARLGTCFDINVVTNGPAPFTMYFSWRPKGSIACVFSQDGLTWTQEPVTCLPPKPEHDWERIVNRTTTVKRGDTWHMWYTGQDTKRGHVSCIGYATSKDGIHFERVSDKPVIVAEAPFEQPSVMCPCAMWDEARQIWRMWYSGGTSYEPDCNCYAESKDGIHWKKFAGNPILTKGDRESWDRDRVAGCEVHRLPDGRYIMFYIGYSDIDTARIGAAISKDGITGWKRLAQNPLVAPDLGTWDSCACYKPSVYRDEKNNRWLLWYNGRNGGPEYVGAVIHEGLDLEAPLERLPNPKTLLEDYVRRFNDCDEEPYKNAIPNDAAEDFLVKNIPYFACPDKDIEQIYYFRWWTFRKHIRKDLGCWTISEFLPNVPWAGAGNMIVCAAGHHLREGRWLRDPQYIVSNAKYWLSDARAKNRWTYSSWLFTGTCQIAELHALDQLPGELLDAAVSMYRRWEQGFMRGRSPMGGDGKGAFLSVDGHEGTEMSLGGNGYKPLFTSAMWSEANMIAAVAKSLGRNELAAEFAAKAAVIAKSLNDTCWNPSVGFYTTATKEGKKGTVRELHGYAPWYFGAPVEGHAADWVQLADPKGFAARYGLTFPERRAPGFALAYKGHECQWNGPSWPFSTTVALTAYMNDLHATKDARVRAASNFPFLVWQYAEQHRCLMADRTMRPWIDENLNPDRRDWIARTVIVKQNMRFARERGKDYNHSAFCDLVISGLVGIQPNGTKGFTVDPLCPETWDYFILDHLRYRGHEVSVRWHRNHGGLTVKIDGREVARRDTLGRLDVSL